MAFYRNIDLGVTGQVVAPRTTKIYWYYIYNAASSVRYVKFYNKATAPSESDVPVLTIPVPATSAANVASPVGGFSAGLSLRATTGVADSDTGAPTGNDVVINLDFA